MGEVLGVGRSLWESTGAPGKRDEGGSRSPGRAKLNECFYELFEYLGVLAEPRNLHESSQCKFLLRGGGVRGAVSGNLRGKTTHG